MSSGVFSFKNLSKFKNLMLFKVFVSLWVFEVIQCTRQFKQWPSPLILGQRENNNLQINGHWRDVFLKK